MKSNGLPSVSKRNILAMLGIAPVSVAALTVQPEDFNRAWPQPSTLEVSPSHIATTKYQPDKMARTFEKLAANIRSHRLTVGNFHIGTNAVGDDGWLRQTLTIDLEAYVKDEPEDHAPQSFANREGFYVCSGCHQPFGMDDKKLVMHDMQAWHLRCIDVSDQPELLKNRSVITHFTKDRAVSVQDMARLTES
jgi:hypothetical protein